MAVPGADNIYVSAEWLSIGLSLCWMLVGVVAYLIYARAEHTWPFGPKEIKEAFIDGA
jgi:hypothetical protein